MTSKLTVTSTRLIKEKQTREKLGHVSPMWLYRHRDELPSAIKIGNRRFWREQDIDLYIEKLFALSVQVEE